MENKNPTLSLSTQSNTEVLPSSPKQPLEQSLETLEVNALDTGSNSDHYSRRSIPQSATVDNVQKKNPKGPPPVLPKPNKLFFKTEENIPAIINTPRQSQDLKDLTENPSDMEFDSRHETRDDSQLDTAKDTKRKNPLPVPPVRHKRNSFCRASKTELGENSTDQQSQDTGNLTLNSLDVASDLEHSSRSTPQINHIDVTEFTNSKPAPPVLPKPCNVSYKADKTKGNVELNEFDTRSKLRTSEFDAAKAFQDKPIPPARHQTPKIFIDTVKDNQVENDFTINRSLSSPVLRKKKLHSPSKPDRPSYTPELGRKSPSPQRSLSERSKSPTPPTRPERPIKLITSDYSDHCKGKCQGAAKTESMHYQKPAMPAKPRPVSPVPPEILATEQLHSEFHKEAVRTDKQSELLTQSTIEREPPPKVPQRPSMIEKKSIVRKLECEYEENADQERYESEATDNTNETDSTRASKPKRPAPPKFSSRNLPSSQACMQSSHEWERLPSTEEELVKALNLINDDKGENNRKQALHHAQLSHVIGRCLDQTSILLLGQSGAGKSSTINHLFCQKTNDTYDHVLLEVSSHKSCTTATEEWLSTSDYEPLKIKDLSLSIIDTPGYGDTRGPKQDACNLISVQEFFKTHQKFQKKYPNIVLIALKGTENRYEGMGSTFTKVLKVIKTMDVVDTKNPNVVIVLTHVMGHGQICYKEKTTEIGSRIVDLCKIYLGVKPPYVCIENNPEDYGLEERGDWMTVLPDGEKQPYNLFKAMLDITIKNNDSLGYLTINHFLAKTPAKAEKLYSVRAPEISTSSRQTEILNVLNNIENAEPKKDLENQIDQWVNENIGENDDESMVFNASVLKVILREKKIDSAKKIENISLREISGIIHPVSLNATMERILQGAFNLKQVTSTRRKQRVIQHRIGDSYDIFKDSVVNKSVFVASKGGEESFTEFGFSIPNHVYMETSARTTVLAKQYSSKEDYIKERLLQLNVNLELEKFTIFKFNPKAGFSIKSDSMKFFKKKERSFRFESILFKLCLEKNADISKEFKTAVNKLPASYNEENKKNFDSFFCTWGHYIIEESFGGGFVSGTTTRDEKNTEKDRGLSFEVEVESKIAAISGDTKAKFQNQSNVSNFLDQSSLQWHGGDNTFHNKQLKDLDSKTWKDWNESLRNQPTILDSFKLQSIVEPAKLVSEQKAEAIREAFEAQIEGKVLEMVGLSRMEQFRNGLRNFFAAPCDVAGGWFMRFGTFLRGRKKR